MPPLSASANVEIVSRMGWPLRWLPACRRLIELRTLYILNPRSHSIARSFVLWTSSNRDHVLLHKAISVLAAGHQ